MKRFNKNILVFVFAALFIGFGVWGCLGGIKDEVFKLFSELKQGNISGIIVFEENIDNISDKNLSYHNELMDINSVKENLIGTRIIVKDDSTVVKSDSGSLYSPAAELSDLDIEQVSSKIKDLKDIAEENGAKFLYCAAPVKANYMNTPANVENFAKNNYGRFITALSQKVPYLDFAEVFEKNNISGDDIFFYTDHHWRPRSAFVAVKAVCEELNTRYGFEYNEEYTDIANYTVENYENWFLGALGKKVGTFFTSRGADDFELIAPVFDTSLTEEQPAKNLIRSGKFEDTVMYIDNIKKDFYAVNSYAAYSGGDFRLQIVRNNLNENGKKVLLIRDSFACAAAPFLALQTAELHICDIRNFEYFVGDRLNIKEYIQEIKPDYVLVLYSGVKSIERANGGYDFID